MLLLFEPLVAFQADLLVDADGLGDHPGEDFEQPSVGQERGVIGERLEHADRARDLGPIKDRQAEVALDLVRVRIGVGGLGLVQKTLVLGDIGDHRRLAGLADPAGHALAHGIAAALLLFGGESHRRDDPELLGRRVHQRQGRPFDGQLLA